MHATMLYLLCMHIVLADIGTRPASKDQVETLCSMFLKRCSAVAQTERESFRSEQALFQWLGRQRDDGAQQIVFAIGPADGWSEDARKRATLLLSLGSFTLAHALARLVLAEQIYRACTILTGHPYHSGH